MGTVKLNVLNGSGKRELGKDLPDIREHLVDVTLVNSVKPHLIAARSKTAQNLVDSVLRALNNQRSYLMVLNTSDGIEYLFSDKYQEVLNHILNRRKKDKTVQVRHVFNPVKDFVQKFSPKDIADIKSDADLLEKLRQIEITNNGSCRFSQADDVIEAQEPPSHLSKKDKIPKTYNVGNQFCRILEGDKKKKTAEISSRKIGKLKAAFSHPSIIEMQSQTSNHFMQQFFAYFIQCIKTDYAALAIVYHPELRKTVLEKFKTKDDLENEIDKETSSTSPQIRAVVYTSLPLHKQINPDELQDINSMEDVLAYCRNLYESRGIDYFYTKDHDNIQPNELGPYSRDMNVIMNVFEKMQKQNIDLKYVWFFVDESDDISIYPSDTNIPFEQVRLFLTKPGHQNSVMLSLDLQRPFDEQLSDYDLSKLTFDGLIKTPIDMVGGKGMILFGDDTIIPSEQIVYLPPKFGKY